MKLREHKRKTANLNSTIILQKMEIDRLTEELAAMTAERDSEQRWACHYSAQTTHLEDQIRALIAERDQYKTLSDSQQRTNFELVEHSAKVMAEQYEQDARSLVLFNAFLKARFACLAFRTWYADYSYEPTDELKELANSVNTALEKAEGIICPDPATYAAALSAAQEGAPHA